MRRTITLCFWTLVSLGIVASARATTIITPMIEKDSTGSAFRCFAVNTGKKPVDLTLELRNSLGTVFEGPLGPFSVQPGAALIIGTNDGTFGYCVVEGEFSKKSLRVSLCTLHRVPSTAWERWWDSDPSERVGSTLQQRQMRIDRMTSGDIPALIERGR